MHLGFPRTRISSFGSAAARAATALLIPLALSSCSAPAVGDSAEVPIAGAGGHSDVPTGAAGSGAAGSGAAGSGLAGAGNGPVVSGKTSSTPPGAYLTNESATGSSAGPCAATPLGDFLAAIRVADPTLADIRAIYDPTTATSDGNFIYAYDLGAAGYDVVFKRGLGDCAAGCTENDYVYFSSSATSPSSCQPVQVGHYHTAWGTGTCLTVEGTPMWTHPNPPDPLTVCGGDSSPRDVRGTYAVSAAGQRTPCTSNAVTAAVARVVKMYIEQSPADLGAGFVTFTSTGDPLVDGVRLPARFQRSRFEAALPATTNTLSCPRAASITAHYDFEGYEPGSLDALEFGDDACGACKGSLSAGLGTAAAIQ
jgi:hypothetical protein